MAYAATGRLDSNPLDTPIRGKSGNVFKLAAPPPAPDVPARGFEPDLTGYLAPAKDGAAVSVMVDPKSDRLQLLEPFAPWNGKDFTDCLLLLKAHGKCTTDHISPAGKWLRYRGHLDHISDNMFLGAINAFTKAAGKGLNQLTGERDQAFAAIARAYRQAGRRWVVVGDQNYGEGSSREHAAMSPRYLGAAAIIVRSFARIHETNLKKQGLLALTFADPADYDRVQESDTLSVTGLAGLAPGKPVVAILRHADGRAETLVLKHTMNDDQIAWFKAGSALNMLARR
jgi:aconitate hydratase